MNYERITVQDCLDLHSLNRAVVIEDGKVTEIVVENNWNGTSN